MSAPSFRVGCVFVVLFVAGTAARLWYLDTLPSPAGDEANWLLVGLQIYRGESPEFESSEMNFVPPTYGYFIAGLYHVFGPSIWSARLTSVLALLLGTAAVVGASLWWRRPALGIFLSALLLFHPWSLLWSRLVFAPYAMSLVLAILAPMCWLIALELPGTWRRGFALVGSGQLLVLGLHFSPLGAIPIIVCGLWTFFRSGAVGFAPWVAAACMVVHALPIVWGALVVAASPVLLSNALTAHESIPEKLARYTLANMDIIAGEATVREFTNVAFRGEKLWLARGGVLLIFGLSLAALLVNRRRMKLSIDESSAEKRPVNGDTSLSQAVRSDQRTLALYRFSLLYLLVAFGGVPIILGVGRSWSMPCIDSERYGFAILAPAFLLLAVLASRIPRYGLILMVFLPVFCILPALRLGNALTQGGGPELGFFNFDGGGWRMWRAVEGPVSVPSYLSQVLHRESMKEPVTLIFSDSFSFHPMEFEIAKNRDPRIAVRILYQGRLTGEYAWPTLPANSLMVFVVWHDSLFARSDRETFPIYFRRGPSFAQDRKEFQRSAIDAHLVEIVPQADGSPLLEIWRGRYPKTPIVNLPPSFPNPADFQ